MITIKRSSKGTVTPIILEYSAGVSVYEEEDEVVKTVSVYFLGIRIYHREEKGDVRFDVNIDNDIEDIQIDVTEY